MPIATNWITAFMLCLALENESWDLIGHFAIHFEQSDATLLHSTEFLQCHVTCVTPSRGKKRLITKIKQSSSATFLQPIVLNVITL